MALPSGYTLDQPQSDEPKTSGLPPGFKVDQPQQTQQTTSSPPAGYFDMPLLGRQPTFSTFLQQAPTQPGLAGHVARSGLGVIQGFAGPLEWAAQQTGLNRVVPESVSRTAKEVLQSSQRGGLESLGGEMVGGVFNPISRAIRPIKVLNEIGGPALRSIMRFAQSVGAGALGGATAQPGNTKEGAEWGGILGGILGVPGAAAAKLGYGNVQQMADRMLDRIPFVKGMVDSLKSAGEAGFNRFWYGHALKPINGKTPAEAGFKGMEDVSNQIGAALDKATQGMWFDGSIGSTAFAALQRTTQVARNNITDSGAWDAYQDTIKRLVTDRLQQTGGRLGPADFQAITSNLATVVRDIKPTSEGARSLRAELDQFRMRMLDNASGGDPAAYKEARRAWAIYATGRDSVKLGSKDGIFSPEELAKEIDKRSGGPNVYGIGQARDQGIANAAQQALFAPTRAARGAAAGRLLNQPQDWAGRVAAGGAPLEQPRQPSYQQVIPGL